jgi:hypothetical protein
MRVVVARDEMPLHGRKLPHAFNRTEKQLKARVNAVIDVAGNEYSRGLFCDGNLAYVLDHIEARITKDSQGFVIDESKGFPNLQVRSVEESHRAQLGAPYQAYSLLAHCRVFIPTSWFETLQFIVVAAIPRPPKDILDVLSVLCS